MLPPYLHPKSDPKPSLQDELFALRNRVEEENQKVVGVVINRLLADESAEWATGFLDRGQRLLEQLNELLYKK